MNPFTPHRADPQTAVGCTRSRAAQRRRPLSRPKGSRQAVTPGFRQVILKPVADRSWCASRSKSSQGCAVPTAAALFSFSVQAVRGRLLSCEFFTRIGNERERYCEVV